MSRVTKSMHPAITMGQAAIAAFAQETYYGVAMLSLRDIEARVAAHFDPVRATMKEAMADPKKATGKAFEVAFQNARKAGKTSPIARKIAVNKMTASFKRDRTLMERAERRMFEKAAKHTLARFERTSGFREAQDVKEAVVGIQAIFQRAGFETWAPTKQKSVERRMKQATRRAHEQSVEEGFLSLETFNDPHKTAQDIQNTGTRIANHIKEMGPLAVEAQEAMTKTIQRAQTEAAFRCFSQRIEAMENMPRFICMTEAEKKEATQQASQLITIAAPNPSVTRQMNAIMHEADAESVKKQPAIQKMMEQIMAYGTEMDTKTKHATQAERPQTVTAPPQNGGPLASF